MDNPIRDLHHLCELVGREVATSDWLDIRQDRIERFADVTGDRQWIHVDVERAREESPLGGTIAHGFLTLSLLSAMAAVVRVPGLSRAINYGLERVRFPSPVPAGSRVRARFLLLAAEPIAGGVKATWRVTVERDGGDKPCCVADWLLLYYE